MTVNQYYTTIALINNSEYMISHAKTITNHINKNKLNYQGNYYLMINKYIYKTELNW